MSELVVGKTNGTIDTLGDPPTIFTIHHGRVSPPVLKNDYLLLVGKGFVDMV
jgi:hypothetical protein